MQNESLANRRKIQRTTKLLNNLAGQDTNVLNLFGVVAFTTPPRFLSVPRLPEVSSPFETPLDSVCANQIEIRVGFQRPNRPNHPIRGKSSFLKPKSPPPLKKPRGFTLSYLWRNKIISKNGKMADTTHNGRPAKT